MKQDTFSNGNKIVFRTSFMVAMGILAIVSFIMLLSSVGVFKPIKYQTLYSYTIDDKISYDVKLNENEFIKSEDIKENDTIIASLIDEIKINYTQFFVGSLAKDFDMSYEVTAQIEGLYNNGGEVNNTSVWTKDYVLSPKKQVLNPWTTANTLTDSVTINYPLFAEEVQKFNHSLGIPINAYLTVTMKIYDDSKDYKYADDVMSVKLPLDDEAFRISTDFTPKRNETKREVVESDVVISYSQVIIYSLLCVASVILFINSFFVLWKNIKKSDYIRVLNRLLKDYDSILVDIVEDIDKLNYQLVKVKSFKELLDLEEELRIPILHYKRNEICNYFYMINQNILYLYKFTEQEVISNKYNS